MTKTYEELINQINWTEGFLKIITCPISWYEPIRKCWAAIHMVDPDCTVCQIKSKFGGLRFYVEYSDQENVAVNSMIDGFVRCAEQEVYEIEHPFNE